ncbi:serine/threonine protein kinase [Promicromonospora soli]|uniref:Serine/threonine protein kinase n=1 Tax=Promicromonospora soli TaxID=2035533 RepID=A0A919FZA6_9MICO|nr:serine/threonine protein kinase [Promicromonospora soli]GHH75170.1 serine/threonine protein kinase [Promicromonospora soli]
MIVTEVDGLPVRLRASHDLSFTARWGSAFAVLDQQDSGNLCLGVEGPAGRVFVKYAGAPTVRYDGAVETAVANLRRSAEVYRALAHPSLVALREAVDVGGGHALVFDWTDATPVGKQYERSHVVRSLAQPARADAVQQIYDFHGHAAALGWVAIDLYDGSVMVDAATGRIVLCDLDFYRQGPTTNRMGRMWGSTRFMSPEEYELGAPIDEVTNVFALGALAHTFLGDDATKSRAAWAGSDAQFAVAARAMCAERDARWTSVAALAEAWRSASAPAARTTS